MVPFPFSPADWSIGGSFSARTVYNLLYEYNVGVVGVCVWGVGCGRGRGVHVVCVWGGV